MKQPLGAGLAVLVVSLLAIVGPLLGVSPAWIVLAVALSLGALTLDSASFGGRGGHVLAEALPGGEARLRRIAIHEAGHVLIAGHENMAMGPVLVGSLACLRAGLNTNGSTALEAPAQAKLAEEDLRRWSRVLQAGMAAEQLIYGESVGGWTIVPCWAAFGAFRDWTWRWPNGSNAGPAGKWTRYSNSARPTWRRRRSGCFWRPPG